MSNKNFISKDNQMKLVNELDDDRRNNMKKFNFILEDANSIRKKTKKNNQSESIKNDKTINRKVTIGDSEEYLTGIKSKEDPSTYKFENEENNYDKNIHSNYLSEYSDNTKNKYNFDGISNKEKIYHNNVDSEKVLGKVKLNLVMEQSIKSIEGLKSNLKNTQHNILIEDENDVEKNLKDKKSNSDMSSMININNNNSSINSIKKESSNKISGNLININKKAHNEKFQLIEENKNTINSNNKVENNILLLKDNNSNDKKDRNFPLNPKIEDDFSNNINKESQFAINAMRIINSGKSIKSNKDKEFISKDINSKQPNIYGSNKNEKDQDFFYNLDTIKVNNININNNKLDFQNNEGKTNSLNLIDDIKENINNNKIKNIFNEDLNLNYSERKFILDEENKKNKNESIDDSSFSSKNRSKNDDIMRKNINNEILEKEINFENKNNKQRYIELIDGIDNTDLKKEKLTSSKSKDYDKERKNENEEKTFYDEQELKRFKKDFDDENVRLIENDNNNKNDNYDINKRLLSNKNKTNLNFHEKQFIDINISKDEDPAKIIYNSIDLKKELTQEAEFKNFLKGNKYFFTY